MIIQNAVEYNGTVFQSTHVHDYVQVTDTFAIDGGSEYIRWAGVPLHEMFDINLMTTDSFDKIADNLVWGTRGVDGRQPLKYIYMKDMDSDHLKKVREILTYVLETKPNAANAIRLAVVDYLLECRG